MMIASNSRALKGGKKEINADYGGMVQPSQQLVAQCVKGVEQGLGTRGLRMVAVIQAGIPVEVTQQAGVVSRRRRAAIGTESSVKLFKKFHAAENIPGSEPLIAMR